MFSKGKKKEVNLTEGSIIGGLIAFAIPLFLGLNLIACPLFAVIDREGFQAFLSKFKKKS